MHLGENSLAVGKTVAVVQKMASGLRVRQVVREEGQAMVPLADLVLRAGDSLLVRDYSNKLKEYEEVLKAALHSDGRTVSVENPLRADDQQLAEFVVMPSSLLVGRSLVNSFFAARFDLAPLGIYRRGASLLSKDLEKETLRSGDVILAQGSRDTITVLRQKGDLTLLDATTDLPRSDKANLTLLIMLAIVLPAAFNWLLIAVTAPLGVLLMVASGCIEWRQLGASVNSSVILLISAGIALSIGLVKTGAATFLAQSFLAVTHGLPPTLVVGV
ncbi:transporter, partial [mine drainage metagenome]